MSTGGKKGRQNNWDIIAAHLAHSSETLVNVTLDEVNQWVGGGLPQSALKYSAWWSGARATWTAEGWIAKPNFDAQTVCFRRMVP